MMIEAKQEHPLLHGRLMTLRRNRDLKMVELRRQMALMTQVPLKRLFVLLSHL